MVSGGQGIASLKETATIVRQPGSIGPSKVTAWVFCKACLRLILLLQSGVNTSNSSFRAHLALIMASQCNSIFILSICTCCDCLVFHNLI